MTSYIVRDAKLTELPLLGNGRKLLIIIGEKLPVIFKGALISLYCRREQRCYKDDMFKYSRRCLCGWLLVHC